MTGLGIATGADIDALGDDAPAVDHFLLDAKPPPDVDAAAFDWSLLLAGGPTPANVAAASCISGAPGVDVSWGVERSPGVKDSAAGRAAA